MEYMNEANPYHQSNAIACYYSFENTCVLHGVVTLKKELLVLDEFNFEKQSITDVSKFLKSLTNYPWINKNDYLGQLLKNCYCLDFTDETDIEQLGDLFKSLLENNRVVFKYEKKENSIREKTLPILVKALSYTLFSDMPPRSYMALLGGKLSNPTMNYETFKY